MAEGFKGTDCQEPIKGVVMILIEKDLFSIWIKTVCREFCPGYFLISMDKYPLFCISIDKFLFQGGITEHKAPFAHEHAEINELEDIVKELKYDFYEDGDVRLMIMLMMSDLLGQKEKKMKTPHLIYESCNFKDKVNKYIFPQTNCPYRGCWCSKSVHRGNH